jgi:methionyl-tRNA synthetase
LQAEARNKMKEWVGEVGESKLSDWDISRDAPYFGFEIPDAPGKYFYVWLDAPIGYYASFLNYCQQKGLNFEEWVKPDSTTEQYHFIGKDILYFHTLFWPATLHFAGYRTPTNVFAHGFLTVDGEKMSKSRGTLISAHSVITTGFNPEWLRYYFATKLNASMEDLDLNLQDFVARVNSDLIGKYVNIASRSAGFLIKQFAGQVADAAMSHSLLNQIRAASEPIATLYETREFAKALRLVMELADQVNAFVNEQKPWELAKDPARQVKLQTVCSITLEAFRALSLYLKPVLPQLAIGVEQFLALPPQQWQDITVPLSSKNPIRPYQHLMGRVEASQIEALIAANH